MDSGEANLARDSCNRTRTGSVHASASVEAVAEGRDRARRVHPSIAREKHSAPSTLVAAVHRNLHLASASHCDTRQLISRVKRAKETHLTKFSEQPLNFPAEKANRRPTRRYPDQRSIEPTHPQRFMQSSQKLRREQRETARDEWIPANLARGCICRPSTKRKRERQPCYVE